MSTIVTILGTQIVSVVPGLSVSAVVPSITAVSTIVTILGTQVVTVVPNLPVQISGITPTTTASGLSGVTGLPVWLVGGAGGGTTLISVVSTIVTILGFSVVTTSSQAATASGLAVWVGNPSAAAAATVNISSVTPTTTQASGVTGLPVWLMASQTMAVSATISGSVNISGIVAVTDAVAGYTTASSGLTATATGLIVVATGTVTAIVIGTVSLVTVSKVGTISHDTGHAGRVRGAGIADPISGIRPPAATVATVVTLLGTVLVSVAAPVSLSGAGVTVTQSSLTTGVPVIFVQTQTIGAVNTIITVLGTQVVTVVPGLSVSAVVSGTVSLAFISGAATTTPAAIRCYGVARMGRQPRVRERRHRDGHVAKRDVDWRSVCGLLRHKLWRSCPRL